MKNRINLVILKMTICMVCMMLLLTGCQKSAEEQLQEQLELGQNYLLEMEYDEARIAFENAIQINPKNMEAYKGLAEVYVAQEEYEKALNILDEAEIQLPEELSIEELREQVFEKQAENVLSQWLDITDWEEVYDLTISENYEEVFQNLYTPAIAVGEDGKGLGIYRKNDRYYIYIGEYDNNLRSGHGIMAGKVAGEENAEGTVSYEGEWDMDYPNGYGEARQIEVWDGEEHTHIVKGNWKDGLQNGSMTAIDDRDTYFYNAVEGWPEIIEEIDGESIFGVREDGEALYTAIFEGEKLGFSPACKDEASHVWF